MHRKKRQKCEKIAGTLFKKNLGDKETYPDPMIVISADDGKSPVRVS